MIDPGTFQINTAPDRLRDLGHLDIAILPDGTVQNMLLEAEALPFSVWTSQLPLNRHAVWRSLSFHFNINNLIYGKEVGIN